jgi:hypothetical protein
MVSACGAVLDDSCAWTVLPQAIATARAIAPLRPTEERSFIDETMATPCEFIVQTPMR